MSKENCKYDNEIINLKEDVREIRKDVKSLLKFKWQVFGGVSVVSFIVATIIGFIK